MVTPVTLQFVRLTADEQIRKLGFTSIGERTDGLTKSNVEELAVAFAAGKLEDKDGAPVVDGNGTAWVQGWILVSAVKPKTEKGVDDEFIGRKNTVRVTVAPPAAATEESAPFGQ